MSIEAVNDLDPAVAANHARQAHQATDEAWLSGQRNDDAELKQYAMNPVDGGRAFGHQTFTRPMQGGEQLLGFGSRLDEAHGGPRRCFADRFGINVVVLVTLHKRTHILRRNQLCAACPIAIELACASQCEPATCLHDHGDRLEVAEKRNQLRRESFLRNISCPFASCACR